LEALAYTYISAFVRKIFLEERWTGVVEPELREARDEMIRLGEKDAVAEARAALHRLGRPEAAESERHALEAYRQLLIDAEGGKFDTAKWRVEMSARERAFKIAGL